MSMQTKYLLNESQMPKFWYNIQADLPKALIEATVLVIVLLALFLGNVRAALTVALVLPLAAQPEDAGVAPGRLDAVGRGEGSPVADNASADGRARNRRVEIIVN